jgi:dimethylglycine dehydrogenase
MPEDFSFQLYPDDLDRLEWHINDAMARVPLLAQANLTKVINGPIPYTPDGNPLIGPMPGVPNAFEACVFTFGICQAGGAGKVLAEWVTEGGTEWDMWSCDPRRFTGWEDHDYLVQKGMEVYGHEYGMHFPMARWPAGADRKLSPVHDKLKALGAQFAPYNGWERAEWYAAPGDDTSWEATQTWGRKGPWEPRIKAECEAVRDGVGVLDLPGFTRLRLVGPGARAHLASLTASKLPSAKPRRSQGTPAWNAMPANSEAPLGTWRGGSIAARSAPWISRRRPTAAAASFASSVIAPLPVPTSSTRAPSSSAAKNPSHRSRSSSV